MVSYTEPKKVELGLVISDGGFKTGIFYLCMLITLHNGPFYPVILFRINRGFTNLSFVHGVFLIKKQKPLNRSALDMNVFW